MLKQRFLRSRPKRTELFLAYEGKCAICRQPLPDRWHSDHIIPWSAGGVTELRNLQPLCPICNIKKADKMPSKPNFEMLSHFSDDFPLSKGMRICQIGAYNCIVQRLVVEGSMSCSCVLPTGTGKSDVARAVAIGLTKRNFCSGVWVFSPSEDLRKQVKDDDVDDCLARLGVRFSMYPFMECTSLDNDRFRNDSVMESFTTQFLINGCHGDGKTNLNKFIVHDELIYKRTGKHTVAIFDESHLFSTDNTWGGAAIKLQEAGIPIVLITGTPFRSDKIRIPGFVDELIDESEKPFVKTKRISDNRLKIERGNCKTKKFRLVADYEYSYARAWEEKVILHPKPTWIDARDVTDDRILSDLSKAESSKMLRSFLLDPATIRHAVSDTIAAIRCRKAMSSDACALVTTLSDSDDSTSDGDDLLQNLHARKIEREFEKQAPELRIKIVTSTCNSDGLTAFKNGDYDVLIVKAMGTIGFNYRPIKVVCHLSSYRTLPALIQLLMRACRKHDRHANFDAILPKDQAMIELWRQLKDEVGLIVEDDKFEVTSTEIKDLTETDQFEEVKPVFVDHNSSCDPIARRSPSDEIIELFRRKDPHLYNKLETQDLLIHFENCARYHPNGYDWLSMMPDYEPAQASSPMVDPNKEESRLRHEAVDAVKEIANELRKCCKKDYVKETFGSEFMKPAWSCVKRLAGFPPAVSLERIAGISNYARIVNACKHVRSKLADVSESKFFDHQMFLAGIRSL